ncbi:hypothetical protein LMJ45_14585 [Enterobacter cloacae]|nr:hypothetical protein [Enterobacter cloacae]UER82245.1 hypothetical protein LMJ45_14585 [Enterobacter cloacae]
MSTITKEFTKEQLIARINQVTAINKYRISRDPDADGLAMDNELFAIALASLEAEPVAWLLSGGGAKNNVSFDSGNAYADPLREVTPLYTAPPAPVSVPDAMEMDDDFDSAFEHGKAVGWNAYRAAMLQGADGTLTNEGTIPVTQFKPVADLYGLTSPTGGETSFTFDAVEARDFIDGGWLCQEYVELERFQEAITNHTEDKLAMVDHSGDSNNMVEHVTTGYKLPGPIKDNQLNSGPDADDYYSGYQAGWNELLEAVSSNSPVTPDGWVLVPEEPTHEMLEAGDEQFGTYDVYRRMIAASPQQK